MSTWSDFLLPSPGGLGNFGLILPRICPWGQMFANLRTPKSEDRSPNPTFPPCKYGQIEAGFALQSPRGSRQSYVASPAHNLKHSADCPSEQKRLIPSNQASINTNTNLLIPTPDMIFVKCFTPAHFLKAQNLPVKKHVNRNISDSTFGI